MAYIRTKEASPPTVNLNVFEVDTFKGVDFYNSPSNVSKSRSPSAPNMIRDEVGKVRKRMGYHLTGTYTDRINGVYILDDKTVVHSGDKLYMDGTAIYTGIQDGRGKSWQLGSKVFISDGKELLCFANFGTDETPDYKVKKASDEAFVPTVVIAKDPDTLAFRKYQDINILSKKWTESFAGTDTTKKYQLQYGDLDETPVTAKKLKSDGTWQDLVENTDFTVNRTSGMVTFNTAPGKTPVAADDNVQITASRDWGDYSDRVNKCSVSVLYGASGQINRLFVSGNPDYPNYIWYSDLNNPFYFPDLNYLTCGQEIGSIVGFSIVSDCLAVHFSYSEDGRNIVLFKDSIAADGSVQFKIVNTILGEPAIGSFNFAFVGGESLFATPLGIYAVTAKDITGERYTQSRSFYIDKALTEENLKDAYAIAYKDFYIIATENKLYILDTLQKSYEKNTPYTSYQYECYHFEIPGVRVMYIVDGKFCFGTSDGNLQEFYTDPTSLASYADNGTAIDAHWDMPDITGDLFYKNKSFKRFSVVIASAIATSVTAYALVRGIWQKIYSSGATARYFDFNYLDFNKLSFSTDATPRTLTTKIKIRKVDKIRLRLENKELNESFGLYKVALEYTENGNYKG